VATPLPLSASSSPDLLAAFLPASESGSPDQREIPLILPDLSVLETDLLQLLTELSPLAQQAVSLPAPDLSALEAGLLQFLAEMGQTSSPLDVDQDKAALWMWVFSAATAGAACAIAYRQCRRAAGAQDVGVSPWPRCPLDNVI
jgi:hypothetical protein